MRRAPAVPARVHGVEADPALSIGELRAAQERGADRCGSVDAADALRVAIAGVETERVGLSQIEPHTGERRTVAQARDLHGDVERRTEPTTHDVGAHETRIEVERTLARVRRDDAAARLR